MLPWYWNLIRLDHPPIVGYALTVVAPGPMAEPYDAFVMRYANPEVPRVRLSADRSTLTVKFRHIPHGDGVEVRYLMDPRSFWLAGSRPALEQLLRDQARVARGGGRAPRPAAIQPRGDRRAWRRSRRSGAARSVLS